MTILDLEKRQRRAKPTPTEIAELRNLFATRWLGVDGLRELEKESGRCFKRGKFSELEKRIIREGLEEYLQERGLSHQEFLDAFFVKKRQSKEVYSDERFKEVFKKVAQKLDGRPILLTYQCMRRMYHPGNSRGRWTPEQDAELQRLFEIHGPDWEAIGMTVGRYGMSCRDRFKAFRGRGSTGPWSNEETSRLQEAVQNVRQKSSGRPCWLLVSELVGTRSVSQCQVKWALLEMRIKNEGRRAVWTQDLDYYLVCRLYDLAVEHESEVVWKDLMDDGWTTYFNHGILRDRFQILGKRVRNHRNTDMDTLLENLMLSLRPLTPDLIDPEDLD